MKKMHCHALLAVLISCTLLLSILASANAQSLEYLNSKGYRSSHYRAPVPDSVPHGKTIDTEQLQQLIETDNPVLIDVLAVVVRPELKDFGMSWLPSEPRYHIPKSVWLPNVGHGELDEDMDNYFRSNLQRLTDGDKARAIVIYCVVDCWMSWNAVQRAASYGYENMYWYPDGTDGWQEKELSLVEGEPVDLQEDDN